MRFTLREMLLTVSATGLLLGWGLDHGGLWLLLRKSQADCKALRVVAEKMAEELQNKQPMAEIYISANYDERGNGGFCTAGKPVQ